MDDNKIAWYMNTGGVFGEQRVITKSATAVQCVFPADVDGDGDTDVLSASGGNDEIAWYENMDGLGSFSEPHVITTSTDFACSVCATDLDGDGDIDVVSASNWDNKIAWYKNLDGYGHFGEQTVLDPDFRGAWGVSTSDLDNDGDQDILATQREFPNSNIWFENLDGKGHFSVKRTICPQDGGRSIIAADLDNDGDRDAIVTTNYKIFWCKNLDGKGVFSDPIVIYSPSEETRSAQAADIDQDGDLDLLAALEGWDSFVWFENTDGKGTFQCHYIVQGSANGAMSIFPADLDGDGDPDVITAAMYENRVSYFLNVDGKGNFGTENIITSEMGSVSSLCLADLDGDGKNDVLATIYFPNQIAWFQNSGVASGFGDARIIDSFDRYELPRLAKASDLDGDGDLDVVSSMGPKWYENTDGKGHFELHAFDGYLQLGFDIGDVEGDGDLDILAQSWYENTDGKGCFIRYQGFNVYDFETFCAADLNGDHRADLLGTLYYDNKIVWYENADGRGRSWTEQVVRDHASLMATGVMTCVVNASDIDGDGDLDIVATAVDTGITWFENLNGLGSFGESNKISLYKRYYSAPLAVSDIDGDGDMDIIVSDISRGLDIYENIDGKGVFRFHERVNEEVNLIAGIYTSDIDSDGDIDILTYQPSSPQITCYENVMTDNAVNYKQFSSSDFSCHLFQNYPNPFNSSTKISFNISRNCHVLLTLFNLNGRRINKIFDNLCTPGDHSLLLNMSEYPSGIYFLRLETGTYQRTLKLIYIQ